jgi:hypothetical protein
MIDNLLFVGDESPSEATSVYGTMMDNQPVVEFDVFENVVKDRVNKYVSPSIDNQGNEQDTDPTLNVKRIGTVCLALPPGSPKGTPIEVIFRCSTAGLEVRATNQQTNESVESVIALDYVKTLEEQNEAARHMASIHISGQIS